MPGTVIWFLALACPEDMIKMKTSKNRLNRPEELNGFIFLMFGLNTYSLEDFRLPPYLFSQQIRIST
jgi:hypothetical protein